MPKTNKIQNIVLTAGGGTTNLPVTDLQDLYIISGTGTLGAGVVIQHSGTPTKDMTYKFLYKATMTYAGANKVTAMGRTLTQEEANGQGIIEANWNGATWDVYMFLDTTEEPIGLSGVETTALATGGGTVDLDPKLTKKYQRFTGTGALSGSWTIQPDVAASPIDGDEFFVLYDCTFTADTVTIFATALTEEQTLNGQVWVWCVYDSTASGWQSIILTDDNTYDSGKVLASSSDTVRDYLDGKVDDETIEVVSDVLRSKFMQEGAGTNAYQQRAYGAVASGTGAVALGTGTASNTYAFAAGNNTTASNTYAFAAGSASIASGFSSFAVGSTPTASGYAAFATGDTTIASGTATFAAGVGSVANNNYASAWGHGSVAYISASWALGGQAFAEVGDAQFLIGTLKRQTTNAAVTDLQTASATGVRRIIIPEDSAFNFEIEVIGVETGGTSGVEGTSFKQNFSGCVKNVNNTTELVGDVIATLPIKDAAFLGSIAITADNAGNYLDVEATGGNNTNINWMATVRLTMTGFGDFDITP